MVFIKLNLPAQLVGHLVVACIQQLYIKLRKYVLN